MSRTCPVCGRLIVGHFNLKVCSDDCRLVYRRIYMRGWKDRHPKPKPELLKIPPLPDDIDRDAFGGWLSGFADGEATFLLRQVVNRLGKPNVLAQFRITLRDDDAEVLKLIRSFWQCGTIHLSDNSRSKIPNAKPVAIYAVQKTADLAGVVIPHFDRLPLRAKKRNDFAIWRQGVELMASVQARPAIGRFGGGGVFPRWTEAEREEIRLLSARLSQVRQYAG